MTEHAVVIAGGGPTGLMLAGELALAGIDVVIIERRASQDVDGSRCRRSALAHDRSARSARHRGTVPRGGASHRQSRSWTSATSPLATTTCSRSGSATSSRILAGWVGELGVPILRGREVVGFAPDDTGVDVELSDDTSLRAEYLVGCDGGRSLIRKAAGIDFPGLDPTTSWMIAEVEMHDEPEIGVRPEGGGIGPVNREEGGGPYGVVLREQQVDHTSDPTLAGSPRSTRRRLRNRLRRAQPELDLPVHRHDPAGVVLPRRTGAARGRRRPRASAAGRPRPQHRRAGRREPRMEAGAGGQPDITRQLARHLPRRTPSGRRPGAAIHDGARRAQHTRRPPPSPARHHGRAAEHGRAAPAHRRDALRSRHPLRPRRGPPVARAAHARPRSADRRRSHARVHRCCTTPSRCSSTSVHPAGSTSLRGRIESGWSTQRTMASGSSRSSARSRRPRPC